MTANQLSYNFDVNFDSIANFSSPGFENSEKSEFLSQAQENIYLDLITPQIDRRSSASQDELNKIIIAELIRNSGDLTPETHNVGTLPSGFTNLPNGQFVFLPVDFFFPLTELADITFTSGYYYDYGSPSFPKRSRTDVYVRPINQLDYNLSVESHIRKPDENTVWRLEYGRQTPTSVIGDTNKKVYELIGDGTYTISKYRATYYRRLIPINLDGEITSELDPFIHRTIVRDAIRIAAASIGDSNKYQMSTIESKKI